MLLDGFRQLLQTRVYRTIGIDGSDDIDMPVGCRIVAGTMVQRHRPDHVVSQFGDFLGLPCIGLSSIEGHLVDSGGEVGTHRLHHLLNACGLVEGDRTIGYLTSIHCTAGDFLSGHGMVGDMVGIEDDGLFQSDGFGHQFPMSLNCTGPQLGSGTVAHKSPVAAMRRTAGGTESIVGGKHPPVVAMKMVTGQGTLDGDRIFKQGRLPEQGIAPYPDISHQVEFAFPTGIRMAMMAHWSLPPLLFR